MRRGLAPSREQARTLISQGLVTVGGAFADKPSRMVGAGEAVLVAGPPPRFVSRGGEKLDAALDRFAVPVAGRRALDLGASTGGFTDCLLQRGAAAVVALDVGTHQLHERLRADPRVTVHERTNLRHVPAGQLGPPFPLVAADLSFISLLTVADSLLDQCAAGADVVLLVKPQFEAGRAEASRGRGVVADPDVWRDVLHRVLGALADRGAAIMGVMVSPLRGARGNVEFLVHLVAPGVAPPRGGAAADLVASVDATIAEASEMAGLDG